jgi:hypothetical protein
MLIVETAFEFCRRVALSRLLSRSSLRQSLTGAAPLVMLVAVLSGCGTNTMADMNFFPDRPQLFRPQDWGSGNKNLAPDLLPSGPVAAEDMVDAAGHCGAPVEAPTGAVTPAAGASTDPASGALPGAITLGMTECQVVAHAGQPAQVNIGVDESNQRKVVLTYNGGPLPGIYTFAAGRLKVMDRVAQPEPVKPARKKSRSAKPATASTR